MLQVLRVFPRVSCLGSAKAVQCPRPGPNIGNKNQQIPRYSPVCPRGHPRGMAADKCIISREYHDNESLIDLSILILWSITSACVSAVPSPTSFRQIYSVLSKAPSTLIRFQTKAELFCSGYGNRPHYNAENDHRKRSHSKTLSRVERFENDAFWKRCFVVWTKNSMLSENGDVIKTTRPWVSKMADRRYHVASISRQFRRPIYWNARASSSFDHGHWGDNSVLKQIRRCSVDGRNDTKTISVDANLFENGAKQLRFRLKTDYCGQGLKLMLKTTAGLFHLPTSSAILYCNDSFPGP